ncbi:DUF1800 domain-containing protein [Brevibacillus dissolubilis]|uniref:DUF1800 domain-containing protein n=1 Tax=Brevibacillus dissolubilis TaxID=1844116 RepID=UPI0011177FA9|nr:DUF1800 domain-containing protein [Brevibacillus dissolubilis]
MPDPIRRLLNRAALGYWEPAITQRTRDQVIALLLKPDPKPYALEATVPYIDKATPDSTADRYKLYEIEAENYGKIQRYWVHRMVNTKYPLQEKMALFWHNHFATGFSKVKHAKLLARQYDIFYKYAFGKLGDMLRLISTDAAMLTWLDGMRNMKYAPNENYARELFELFTLGVGHYTEKDVKETARALTGWQLDTTTGKVYFHRPYHDSGGKTIFGKSGKFALADVIRIILENPQTARFITEKVLQTFVTPTPKKQDIERFAAIYRKSQYEMRTLLKAVLSDPLFDIEAKKRSLVRPPVDLLVASYRAGAVPMRPEFIYSYLFECGQTLFNPPSVAGWEGGHAWIASAPMIARYRLAKEIGQTAWNLTTKNRIYKGSDVILFWAKRLCFVPSQTTLDTLLPYTNGGSAVKAPNLQAMLTLLVFAPENQRY